MTDRESIVVLGVLTGLVVVTVVPFAAPALQLGDEAPTGSVSSTATSPSLGASGSGTTAERNQLMQAQQSLSSPTSPTSTPSDPSQTTGSGTTYQCVAGADPRAAERLLHQTPVPTLTAAGVDVAVIDPSGFDVDDPRIEENVVATRSFSSTESLSIGNGGDPNHGTESAAIATHVAPAADLHLANFVNDTDFIQAMEWATRREVDVIVAPVTFFAKPNDGSAPVSMAVTNATEHGIPVVLPAGNVANRHWEGTYRGGPALEFSPNETRQYLRGSDPTVQIWLRWNRSEGEQSDQFEVVLYKDIGDQSVRVASSDVPPRATVGTNQVLVEGIGTNSLLSQSIEEGAFYLQVTGPPDVVMQMELVSVNHRLVDPTPEGSLLAPATARGEVIVVGAARRGRPSPLELSSRGPTADGRTGVDLLGPGTAIVGNGATFRGTSVATAYTGGVAALLKAARPDLTPGEVEAILQETADAGPSGNPTVSLGHGVLDPDGAIDCVAVADPAADLSTGGD